jgi:hypothetical protein
MKNKMKKSLLFGILILGFSLFTNCEKDESIISEQQNPQNVHRISLNDFNSAIKKDESYNKLESYFDFSQKNNNQSLNRIEQDDEITVLTNDILLIQKGDINYYTFNVLTNNSDDEFYNLVVHVNNNQEIIKSEIYEYNPTDIWLQDTSQPYSGYVSVVENDIIDLNSVFARVGNNCVVGASGYWECSYGNTGDDHAPGECNGTSSNYIIELEYGPCSNNGQTYIAGDEEVSSGGGTWSPSGGGGNNTGNDNQDNTNDTDDDTTPVIPMEPTVQEEILNCINGLSILGSNNQTSIDPEIFEQLNLSKFQWAEINSNLQDSGCSEEAQQEAIEDLIEEYINQVLEDNPFLLLEIDCNQIQNWQTLAQHTAPQSVQNKINSLPSSLTNDFEIQALSDAGGTMVNLDYFSVNVTNLPNNPNTNTQFTADEFLDYTRRNFNDFVEGSTFEPYCEISSMCQTETDLWNSNNPLGSIIYIDIPFDDGVVVCTEYTNSYWYFMTMNAPYAGNHPVSGTRQFGYEQNLDGSYNFFVRGVDRFASNIAENLAWATQSGDAFQGADDLWSSFQEKLNNFVNNPINGGTSTIVTPTKNRPDWEKVEQVLNGELPVSELDCN